jgi:hypothetical protein
MDEQLGIQAVVFFHVYQGKLTIDPAADQSFVGFQLEKLSRLEGDIYAHGLLIAHVVEYDRLQILNAHKQITLNELQ